MGLDDKFNELKGKAKEAVGDLTNNDKLEAEGKADQVKAKAAGAADDAKDSAGNAADSLKDKAEGVRDSFGNNNK